MLVTPAPREVDKTMTGTCWSLAYPRPRSKNRLCLRKNVFVGSSEDLIGRGRIGEWVDGDLEIFEHSIKDKVIRE